LNNLVTDQDYILASNDKENKRIIDRACYKYRNLMDGDDLISCKTVGLWNCLRRYDPKLGNTFKNSLYRNVLWECKAILSKRRIKTRTLEGIDIEINNHSLAVDLPNILTDDEKKVIEQKVFYSLSLQEISKKNSWSLSKTRRIFKKAKENIKKENKMHTKKAREDKGFNEDSYYNPSLSDKANSLGQSEKSEKEVTKKEDDSNDRQ